jgi:anionic cell wall polymer biosynthesis LytR-Cps2A-Psr (LCP) family protein
VRSVKLGPITLGKVGYTVACIAAAITLAAAGYVHKVVGLTGALGNGAGLGGAPSAGASAGAMNILVMGLESRTTFQGQDLSVQQLTETHSGSESAVAAGLEGSQDTDTLILIHIFGGGQKAVGFSIPRDDVVNYPHATFDGLTEGKVDAAYAYAYAESLDQTDGSKMSQAQRYLAANQAGQLFEVQTVESFTGVHIDHFIESNIIGFYELAQQFGGLEVCIQPAPAQDGLSAGANLTDYNPLTDPSSESPGGNSGFDAYRDGYNSKKRGKQYLHLSAAQSLAYVRSRDTLPGVDIGRTARQQAAIAYILWKLKTDGVLSDVSQIDTLLSNAKGWLMYDSDWNLLDFAQDMDALSGNGLHFTTLPELSLNDVDIPDYGSPQSANYIDVQQIQQQVNQSFYGTSMVPGSAPQVTVDVYNGGSTSGLAGLVSQDLVAMGYKAGSVADPSSQSQKVQTETEVFYGGGGAAEANAQAIANVMGVQQATSLSSLPAGHVEVLLGSQVAAQAPGLELFGADSVNAEDYVTGAEQQDNESASQIPADIMAAYNSTPSSEVPAYSHSSSSAGHAPSSPGSSSSPGPSSSAGSPQPGKSASKPSSTPKGKKSSTAPAKKSSSGGSSSSASTGSNPRYGLTTCSY